MKKNIVHTIIICLLFFISSSVKAQTSKVYWDQVINSNLTSSTSFETVDKNVLYILPAGYSVNTLIANEDGGVEASLQDIGKYAILALTAKQDGKVIIESDKYVFKKNLDYYIEAKTTGYEVNETFIPFQVKENDIVKIMRIENTMYFSVNGKTIYEVEAIDSHLFPLVSVVVTQKASNVTFFNEYSEQLLVKSTSTSTYANVMGTLDIEVFGGHPPYVYKWEHTKENIPSLKGLNVGTYNVSITDVKGENIKKTYNIDTEVFFGKSNSSSNQFNVISQPLSLISGEYIAKDKQGRMYWSEAAVRGNIYIGFTETNELSTTLKNDLLYSFLLDEEQVHINFEGKIIYSSARTKNLNTLYSITKEDGHIVFAINGKEVIKKKYTQAISLSPKAILLNKAQLGTIKGNFTGTNEIDLQNDFTESQVKTTAYFKQQQLVWLGSDKIQIAENELPALQDGWIKWYGKSTDVWFESTDKKIVQFDSKTEKIEKYNYRIQRDKNVISFYENGIFQNALSVDPNQNLLVKTSSIEQIKAEASFGRCGSGGFGPTNKWYFGHNSGISFETNTPSALTNGITETYEGTGVISDENGDVLFYTDGHKVFTKNHTVMTNGDGLLGKPSATQKGLIVPDPKVYPNGEKRYYIFYSTDVDSYTLATPITMYYAVVKFSSPTDLGQVIPTQKNIPLNASGLDERVTAVKHATLNAYWIIVRKHNTTPNEYMSYLLTEDGLVDASTLLAASPAVPIISQVGLGDADLSTSTTITPGFIGQIKLSPNSKWLAVANVRRDFYSSIQIFPFDAQTGQIGTAKFTVMAGAGIFQNVYGIEFSPDGRYLYAADMFCGNAKILKYDLNSATNTVFTASMVIISGDPYGVPSNLRPNVAPFDCIGALQLGPDGKIYVSRYFQQEQLDRGLNPAEIAVGSINPETDAYDKLAVQMPQTGMARFPRYGLPGFVQSFLPCAEFYFGDDIVATGQTSVTISFPSNFSATPTSYLWSTGQTTPTIAVTTSGTYTLTITYGDPLCGKECTVSDEIEVTFDTTPCSPLPNDKKWYFGQNSGLDFTTTPPTPLTDGQTGFGWEGVSQISNENGDLLFYTDGKTVWNSNHQIFNNGTNLMGNGSASQGIMVIEKPNSQGRYLIIHTMGSHPALPVGVAMYYSEVEISSSFPNGTVVTKNVLIKSNATERVGAITQQNGIDYWLITREVDSDKYYSYSITQNGVNISNPIISSVAVNLPTLTYGKTHYGEIDFSNDGTKIAIVNGHDRTGNGSYIGVVEAYSFDRTTGMLGDLIFKDETILAPYGVEFSPNNSLLYISDRTGTNRALYQYDMNVPNIVNSRITIAQQTGISITPIGNDNCCKVGSLQTAPDGKIYLTKNNSTSLGVINNPNQLGIACQYTDTQVNLGGKLANLALPAYPTRPVGCQTFSLGLDRTVAIGQTTILSITNTNNPNFTYTPTSYLWSTGETTPSITVSTAGTYTLTITYINDCGTECKVSDEIKITFQNAGSPCELPLQITDIFSCDTYTLTAQDGFTDYKWNTGEQGRTLIVHSDGEYSVTAFDAINNCIRKGVFYASSNDLCYEEKPAVTTTTTSFNEVLSVSVVNYSDSWLKLIKPKSNQNPFLNAQKGVWRADASFAYMQSRSAIEETGATDVDLSKDGTFNLQMLNWGYHGNLYSENWRKVATLEQYNAEGFEVENRDILGRYSSALYGYHNQLSTAVATNARYSEIAYEGFEEYNTPKIKSTDLTTSNFDFLTFSDDESSSASIYSYRHHTIVWAESNTATIEVNTGRPFLSTTATLKVVPISTQLTQVIENVPVTLTPHTSRTWKANLSTSNLPAKWKGSIAFSTTHKVVPLFDINETKVKVAQDYGHTGQKSLLVTGNAGFEQVRFDPLPGRSYIISLWVSVKDADVPTFISDNGMPEETRRGVKIKFEGSTEEFFFEPTGRIIEGWQRIEGTFCVPKRYDKLSITLQSGRNETTYFDDMRLHPFDGNIQTYVYDPNNYLLRAVLDRNNFATLYYYDAEQQLRLVKKETERGVKTIQEVGNNMPSTKTD